MILGKIRKSKSETWNASVTTKSSVLNQGHQDELPSAEVLKGFETGGLLSPSQSVLQVQAPPQMRLREDLPVSIFEQDPHESISRSPWSSLKARILRARDNLTYFFFRKRTKESTPTKINNPRFRFVDWVHTILVLKFHWQLLFVLVVYFLVSGFFGLLFFFAGDGSIRGYEEPGDFLWLAIQTLTTVGYGRLEPATTYTHIVGSIDALAGILLLSLTAGLIFTYVSQPHSRCLFAEKCVMEPESHTSNGNRRLHIRLLNLRRSYLYDVNLYVHLRYHTPNEAIGGILYHSQRLSLYDEGHHPCILLGCSFYHDVDSKSPLLGKDETWLRKHNATILAALVCQDGDYNSTTTSSIVYTADDIRFDNLFVNIKVHSPSDPQNYILDCENLHRTFNPCEPLRNFFDLLDGDNDGEVSEAEIEQSLSQKEYGLVWRNTIKQVKHHFRELDRDRNGYLSWEEFKKGFLSYREDQPDNFLS